MMQKRCAFLTVAVEARFIEDDELLRQPLADAGWEMVWVPWQQLGVDWTAYDGVVIRSTWNYQHDPDAFLAVLHEIEASGVPLFNDLSLVAWNMHKGYLRDLSARGVGIVPTLWGQNLTPIRIRQLFGELLTDSLVIKPVIGASAIDTFRLNADAGMMELVGVAGAFAERPYMVQPFMPEIVNEGEYSLFFFGGQFSHAIVKRPVQGDFRVQEEYGGESIATVPEPLLLSRAQQVLATLEVVPLYARVDLVRDEDDFVLMELELVEPALYFGVDAEAPVRFVRALASKISQ